MKLNAKQLKFAELYFKTGNATQSYKDAGYSAKSDDIARASASQILTNVNVSAYILKLKEQHAQESKITRDSLIAKAAEIAFSDLNDVVEVREGRLQLKDGVQDLNQFDGLSATYTLSESSSEKSGDTSSGSSSSSSETKSFSIKRADRNKALDTLAKLIGAYDRDEGDSNRDLAGTAAKILGALARVRPK